MAERLKFNPHSLNRAKEYKWYYYLIEFYEVLKQIYFPIFAIIIEALSFILLAPGEDMMRILPNIGFTNQLIICFLFIWCALIIWYGSRIVLHFSNIHYINEQISEKFQKWIPRIYSGLFMLIFILAILMAHGKNYENSRCKCDIIIKFI